MSLDILLIVITAGVVAGVFIYGFRQYNETKGGPVMVKDLLNRCPPDGEGKKVFLDTVLDACLGQYSEFDFRLEEQSDDFLLLYHSCESEPVARFYAMSATVEAVRSECQAHLDKYHPERRDADCKTLTTDKGGSISEQGQQFNRH